MEAMQCQLRLLGPIDNLPPGYFFLCPLTEIQTELPGHFRVPADAAYWSRDPSGMEHLSTEEARNEGFPDIEFCMWGCGRTWDDGVYTGVRQFHQAKGFDPYSQEVATRLDIAVDSSDGLIVQKNDTEDNSDSEGDDDFSYSEDEEPDAVQDTALNGDTEVKPYESEDFLPNLRETDDGDSILNHFFTSNSDCLRLSASDQPISSKRARFLSPGPLPHEALNLSGDNPTSFASSSRVMLNDLRSSNNVLLPTTPLGELDDLGDPLCDLDAAEVDTVMILLQLGARS
ncbi:hypothetical protein B0H19DRAFT_1272850 [Mycena capillaripes]|nr:hypothetical protein B0H19DRAFT_1272850 [Mycena capillaripes]